MIYTLDIDARKQAMARTRMSLLLYSFFWGALCWCAMNMAELSVAAADAHDAAVIPYLEFNSPGNRNGGFDGLGPEDVVPGWDVVGSAGFVWRPSTETARSGDVSMAAVLNAKTYIGQETMLASSTFTARPGDAIKFNAWFRYKGKPGAMPVIRIEVLQNERWVPLKPTPFRHGPPTTDWFPLGKTVVMPDNASDARLVIIARNITDSEATWHVDDAFYEVISFRAYAEAHGERPRLNDMLLLGTDTLRQSPLGCYGAVNSHTPNMDALAEEGLLFRHVLATSMWTRPSFASIFTSLYPSQHTAELHNSVLPDNVVTLAELLREHGYFTVGFAKTRFDGFVGPGAGFAKGFDAFFHVDDVDLTSELAMSFMDANSDALAALEGGGLFIFWHLFDPHAPYRNHYPGMLVNQGLVEPYGAFNIHQQLHGVVLWEKIYPQRPGVANALDVEYARNLYYAEAWHTDRLIGEMITRLRFLGLYEAMHVILCSDHGESFNETEGVWNHGNPYNTCAEVPLIVRAPGLTTPGSRNESDLVTNLDIMPTMLTMAGIESPAWLEGVCLLTGEFPRSSPWGVAEDRKCGSLIIRDQRHKLIAIPASLPVVSEGDPYQVWKAMQPGISGHAVTEIELETRRDWVFADPDAPTRFELYDLETDPFENQDLAEIKPEKLRELLLHLLGHCLYTGITSLEELKAAHHLGLSASELAALEQYAGKGRVSPVFTPEYLELEPDTIEALKAQGYF